MIKHFMYCPFTGLGNYNGFRGNAWLKNRIEVFKQFVVPSLQAQTCKDFTLWISWRPEEKSNKYVREFIYCLENHYSLKVINTFNGLCFYDDKYDDELARQRLTSNLHYTIGELYDVIGEADTILMTIQPSDDLYDRYAVETLQWMFKNEPHWEAIGFKKGYIMNYLTKEVAEYNPETNPPFYTIKFTKEQFTNPLRHIEYTGMKKEVGKYKIGTPLPSHEYIGDCLNYYQIDERGFLVGTHLNNISTGFNIPYKGEAVGQEVLKDFGIYDVPPIKLSVPLRKRLLFSLPYKWQRKIRYLLTEKYAKPV